MKLASLKNGTRDGQLVVVTSDLSRYVAVPDIAVNLQSALDDWQIIRPKLEAVSQDLESRKTEGSQFSQEICESPLPRSYQWLDGSAYINHVELVRKARGAEVPKSFYIDPLMYQGGSDAFLAPFDNIPLGDAAWGCDMEGEIAVITDDVPEGVSVEEAGDHIKLIMLCNDISLRNLIPAELSKGFGFVQSKPPCAFSPICVTPDELGGAWKNYLIYLPLYVYYNGKLFGRANAARDATFNMAELVAHAAKTRPLRAGTIIGSGTVSNKGADAGPGAEVSAGGDGYSCIAELRMIETIRDGQPSTGFMKAGDVVKIEMLDSNKVSIFGEINQAVEIQNRK